MRLPRITLIASLLMVMPVVLTEARVVHQPPPPLAVQIARVPKPEQNDRLSVDNAAVRAAMNYYRSHRKTWRNPRYLTVIDYTKPSYSKRMYLIDLKSGRARRYLVAHGKKSGAVYATEFSNAMESLKSCRGPFLTGRTYEGSHGTSLVLYGLQKGVNDKAYQRGIVLHGADYVDYRAVAINHGRLGRSLGCPAVPPAAVDEIVDKIKNGSLLYIHADSEEREAMKATRVRPPMKRSAQRVMPSIKHSLQGPKAKSRGRG